MLVLEAGWARRRWTQRLSKRWSGLEDAGLKDAGLGKAGHGKAGLGAARLGTRRRDQWLKRWAS